MDTRTKLQYRYSQCSRILGSNVVDQEWNYFKEYARRFDNNPVDKRYGILVMGSELSQENMLYASDADILRILHLERLSNPNHFVGINDGHKVRKMVDWLEKMEGKQ
jgi:hypothetical protein